MAGVYFTDLLKHKTTLVYCILSVESKGLKLVTVLPQANTEIAGLNLGGRQGLFMLSSLAPILYFIAIEIQVLSLYPGPCKMKPI